MHSRRARALLILSGLALVLAWGLWHPLPRHGAAIPVERTDSAYYVTVIERVASGESYYAALNRELRAHGYPTGSVFNWRPPTLTVALARAPAVMRVLLVIVTLAIILATYLLFARSTPEIMLFALLMQIGASATAFTPLAFVLHETWAGAFVGLSALLYTHGHFRTGAVLGLAGLFVRELIVPYAGICGLLALRHRRRGELAIWIAGGLAWCLFYYFHAAAVARFIGPADLTHPSWVQFGGWSFVLATIGFGGWFYHLPPSAAGVGGVLLLASPFAAPRAAHVKSAALAYAGFFFVVGQPFNQSWGILTASLWAIAYALGLLGIVRLTREALGRSSTSRARPVPSHQQ